MRTVVHIRTDGNAEIGLGHLVRCISLAHMLKEEFDIHFFCKEIPFEFERQILEQGWNITIISDVSEFLSSLKHKDIVVLDGYNFDSDYQKRIKKIGVDLVCIDDFHNQYHYADIIINHAPGVIENDYKSEPYTHFLLGPKYALLRPEFLELRNHESVESLESKKILICFGGSDYKNLTCFVLECLIDRAFDITVIVGSEYQFLEDLNRFLHKKKVSNIILKSSLSAKEMRDEIANTDIAIVPSSGILFEVISLHVPALSGYYVDNQALIYDGFKKMRAFIDIEDFNRDCIMSALDNLSLKLLANIKENQKKVIDNKSGMRILAEFKKLI